MNSINNYKRRFFNLLESQMGNVKPLMEDNETKFSNEPEVGLPHIKNTMQQMDVEDVDPFSSEELDSMKYMVIKIKLDTGSLIELNSFEDTHKFQGGVFKGIYRDSKQTITGEYECGKPNEFNVTSSDVKTDLGIRKISNEASIKLSDGAKCKSSSTKAKPNIEPPIVITIGTHKINVTHFIKEDKGCLYVGHPVSGLGKQTLFSHDCNAKQVYVTRTVLQSEQSGLVNIDPKDSKILDDKCGCTEYSMNKTQNNNLA